MRSILDKLFQAKGSPMGLDISPDCVRMIQLSCRGEQFCVEGAEREPLDPRLELDSPLRRRQVLEAIRAVLDRGRFVGRQVISCLPGDFLKIKSMRLDSTDEETLEKILTGDVMKRFGLDIETDEVRWLVAGSVFQGEEIKNEVIFFGVNRRRLGDHIQMLQEAGLDPVSVEAMPCALFRSFQCSLRRQEDQEVVSVLVSLGTHYTTVIIGRGNGIAFVKQIPLAGEHLNRAVAGHLKVEAGEAIRLVQMLQEPEEKQGDALTRQAVMEAMRPTIEDLAREISLCFKYYAVTFRGQRPSEAIFAGGSTYESVLMDALRRHLNVDIQVAQPLRGFDLSRAAFDRRPNPNLCEWAVAVGLALKDQSICMSSQTREKQESVKA
jgi:type IV pilus assembly protein PilM